MNNVLFNFLSSLTMNGHSLSSVFSSFICGALGTAKYTSGIGFFFMRVFYGIAKFMLLFVDIIFSYIRRLCGLEMDFTSLSSMFSAKSDIVFNLLITSRNTIIPIIKNLIVIAIVLIIVFTIIALIKSQFDSLKNGRVTSVTSTIKKTIRALLLLILTPMMAVVGIVFSDLLLRSLYNATNTSGGMSLGTQIFSVSSTSANAYRKYAEENKCIPVVCDFSEQEKYAEYFSNTTLSASYKQYLTNTGENGNLVYITYMQYLDDNFYSYDALKSQTNKDAYYGVYDHNADNRSIRLESYPEEYYVMADVVDYAVNTGTPVYFMTIEKVIDSLTGLYKEGVDSSSSLASDVIIINNKVSDLYSQLISKYGIQFSYSGFNRNEDGELDTITLASLNIDSYKRKDWSLISYTSNYLSDDSTLNQIRYYHLNGKTDELEGAQYVMAVEKSFIVNGVVKTYFEPLSNGYESNYYTKFYSDYIMSGSIIDAKGIMQGSAYPTIIKETAGNNITFYRENIENSVSGEAKDAAKASIGMKSKGLFAMLSLFFKKDDAIEINVEFDNSIVLDYKGESENVATISNGRMQLGYYFDKDYVSGTASEFALSHFFIMSKINIIVMIAAPIILIKMSLMAFLGLIQRSLELFLIIIMYPAACVALPLDERGYDSWWREYLKKLFQTYGLILGINFVLMLFPIISKMEFFTQEDIGRNKLIPRVGGLLFGLLSVRQITTMFNVLVAILFELVAFTLLQTVPNAINKILGTDEIKSSALEQIMKIINNIKKAVGVAYKVFSTVVTTVFPQIGGIFKGGESMSRAEKMHKNAMKFKKFMRKLVPGSKLIEDAKTKLGTKKAKKDKKDKNSALDKLLNDTAHKEPEKPGQEPKAPKEPGENASEEEKEKYKADKAEFDQKKAEYDQKKEEHDKWEKDYGPAAIEKKFEEATAAENNYQQSFNETDETRAEAKYRAKREEKEKKKLGIEDETTQKGDKKDDGKKSQSDGSDDDDPVVKSKHELKREQKQLKKEIKEEKKHESRMKRLKAREWLNNHALIGGAVKLLSLGFAGNKLSDVEESALHHYKENPNEYKNNISSLENQMQDVKNQRNGMQRHTSIGARADFSETVGELHSIDSKLKDPNLSPDERKKLEAQKQELEAKKKGLYGKIGSKGRKIELQRLQNEYGDYNSMNNDIENIDVQLNNPNLPQAERAKLEAQKNEILAHKKEMEKLDNIVNAKQKSRQQRKDAKQTISNANSRISEIDKKMHNPNITHDELEELREEKNQLELERENATRKASKHQQKKEEKRKAGEKLTEIVKQLENPNLSPSERAALEEQKMKAYANSGFWRKRGENFANLNPARRIRKIVREAEENLFNQTQKGPKRIIQKIGQAFVLKKRSMSNFNERSLSRQVSNLTNGKSLQDLTPEELQRIKQDHPYLEERIRKYQNRHNFTENLIDNQLSSRTNQARIDAEKKRKRQEQRFKNLDATKNPFKLIPKIVLTNHRKNKAGENEDVKNSITLKEQAVKDLRDSLKQGGLSIKERNKIANQIAEFEKELASLKRNESVNESFINYQATPKKIRLRREKDKKLREQAIENLKDRNIQNPNEQQIDDEIYNLKHKHQANVQQNREYRVRRKGLGNHLDRALGKEKDALSKKINNFYQTDGDMDEEIDKLTDADIEKMIDTAKVSEKQAEMLKKYRKILHNKRAINKKDSLKNNS